MATKKQKDHAWENAKKIRGKNPDLYRKDQQNNIIYKPSYGKTSDMGWEVDHKNPKTTKGLNH